MKHQKVIVRISMYVSKEKILLKLKTNFLSFHNLINLLGGKFDVKEQKTYFR